MNKAVYKTILVHFSGAFVISPVLADPPPPNVPQVEFVDPSGTDLVSFVTSVPSPRIDVPGLNFSFTPTLPPYRHNYSDAITVQEDLYTSLTHDQVTFEGRSYQFTSVYGGQYGLWLFKPERQTQGASLVQINSTTYQLTTPDGTVVTYDASFRSSEYAITNEPALLSGSPDEPGFFATAVSATRADGEKIDYYYSVNSNGTRSLRAIQSSLGWIIKIDSGIFTRCYNHLCRLGAEPSKVYMVNTSTDYCGPLASICTPSSGSARREIGISTANGFEFVYKNKSGVEIFRNKYSTPSGVAGGYRYPSGRTFTFSNPGFGLLPVQSGDVQAGTSIWSYYRAPFDTNGTNNPMLYTHLVTSTNPEGKSKNAKFYAIQRVPIEITDERGLKTAYQFDTDRYLTRKINPDATYNGSIVTGGYSEYSYDARRNLTQTRLYPKGGGTPLVQSFGYEASCSSSNFRFCNKVKSYTDQNGNISTYVYSADHGGIVSETYPADADGRRKQVRYSYQQVYPLVALSGGGTSSATPVWRVSKKSECVTSSAADPASCVGTASEAIEEYSYNVRNVTLASKKIRLGDGTLLGTETYTYGYFGELLSATTLRNDVNTTRYYVYDVDGKLTYEISPDPDGSGTLSRKVVKHIYDSDGRESETQEGYGSMTDGSDFVWQKKTRFTYDLSTGKVAKREEVTP